MTANILNNMPDTVPSYALHRAERLALDYLEAELTMREQGIHETIVVFGGTRIRELSEPPANGEPDYYALAREFGAIVGHSGKGPEDCRLTLMTGGGPGIMEAANRGASDVGAKSIGLNIHLPHEQVPNPYVTDKLQFHFRYFAIRKFHFMQRARALVVFPGGFGTFDELFETLNLMQTRKIEPLPVILFGEQFWRTAFNAEFLAATGVIDTEDLALFCYVETAAQAWQKILTWHRSAGMPLMCDDEYEGC